MRYAAESGTAFSIARKENVAIDIFGAVRLASTNLLADPTLSDFEPDGSLRYWPKLSAPPSPVGRNVYVREPGGVFTRQNRSTIDVDRGAWRQKLALINGAPLPPYKTPYGLQKARYPRLFTTPIHRSGYPAADYWRSYCWAVKIPGGRWAITGPAPPVQFSSAEDQQTEQPLPEEMPEGVDGIAIVESRPDGPPDRLFLQGIVDVRDFVPETIEMDGPPRYGRRKAGDNETYIGEYNRLGRIEVRKRRFFQKLQWTDARISFKFRTEFGWSASQGTRRVQHRYGQANRRLEARPAWLPKRAEAWVLQIEGPDGQWYDTEYGQAAEELRVNQWGWWIVADPEKLREVGHWRGPGGAGNTINRGMRMSSSERSTEDETGVPDPEEELEDPLVFGKAKIGPGKKVVRTTDVYELDDGTEVESPPSQPKRIDLAQDEGILIDFREFAEEGNIIPNGNFEDQEVKDGRAVPVGYDYEASEASEAGGNIDVTAGESVVEFDDSSGRTNFEDIFVSPKWRVFSGSRYTLRGGIVLDRAAGGKAILIFHFYDFNGDWTGTSETLVSASSTSKRIADRRVGPSPPYANVDLVMPENAAYCAFACRLSGTSSVGARDLAGRFIHIGMFRARSAPRKAEPDIVGPVPRRRAGEVAVPARKLHPRRGRAIVVQRKRQRPGVLRLELRAQAPAALRGRP